jgi:MFS family permease
MLGSEKRRLIIFSCLSAILSFVFSGLDVVFTAYAVNDIAVSEQEFSLMRSFRSLSSVLVVFLMGCYVNVIGNRRAVIVSAFLLLLSTILIVLFPTKLFLFIVFPLVGAFTSALLVNMNIMAQDTAKSYRERSNTTYRSIFLVFSIAGPLVAGVLLKLDDFLSFLFFSLVIGLSIFVAASYPSGDLNNSSPKSSLSISGVVKQWIVLSRNRAFLIFALLTGLINQLGMINLIIIPYKLMDRMSMSEQHYSFLITSHALFGLVLTLVAGYFLKRIINLVIILPYVLCMSANIFMGLSSNVIVVAALFIFANAVFFMAMAPHSLWIGAKVDDDLATAFSLAKIISSLWGFVIALLLSLVQPLLGIDFSLIVFGVTGLLVSLVLGVLLYQIDRGMIMTREYTANKQSL